MDKVWMRVNKQNVEVPDPEKEKDEIKQKVTNYITKNGNLIRSTDDFMEKLYQ